jgi:hypothetical protein
MALFVNKSISGSTVCPNGFGNNARYPSSNINLKVKITNFIRTNDLEQIERTIDAAQVIVSVKDEVETPHFKLMFEEGYRARSICSRSFVRIKLVILTCIGNFK